MQLPGNKMLSQMQEQMKQTRDALAEERLAVTSDGGAVTIVISGTQRVQSVRVSSELLEGGNVDILGNLLVATINKAIEQSQIMAAERLGALAGGMGLPGF